MIDSHAHLTSDTLFGELENILARAQAAEVKAIINICTNASTLERGLTLKKTCHWVFNAASTTPHDVDKQGEALFPLMEKHAFNGDLVAVGETGLDYHYYSATKEIQQHFLRRYLHLALSTQLPVIIHCREAFSDLLHILDSDYKINGKYGKGVLHCFTGTQAEAEQLLSRGWFLSFSGIVTFKKSQSLCEVVKITPLEQLLVETDSPYLAPRAKRSQINEPSFLYETIAHIAQIKGLSPAEVVQVTSINAKALFKL